MVTGCTDPISPNPNRLGYGYWPMDSGQVRTYFITDIDYPLVGEVDTQRYYLQERVGEILRQTDTDTVWALRRYTRTDTTQEWHLDSLWQARKTLTQGIVVENNVPVVKITFPVAEGADWDAHALSARGTKTYFIERLGDTTVIGNATYDPTLRVIQSNNQDVLIMQDFAQEIFADRIGLILRESRQFRYCNEDSCLGQQIIELGRHFRQTLIEHEP